MVSPPSSVLRPRMDYCTVKRTLARVRPRTWHFLLFSIATPLSWILSYWDYWVQIIPKNAKRYRWVKFGPDGYYFKPNLFLWNIIFTFYSRVFGHSSISLLLGGLHVDVILFFTTWNTWTSWQDPWGNEPHDRIHAPTIFFEDLAILDLRNSNF